MTRNEGEEEIVQNSRSCNLSLRQFTDNYKDLLFVIRQVNVGPKLYGFKRSFPPPPRTEKRKTILKTSILYRNTKRTFKITYVSEDVDSLSECSLWWLLFSFSSYRLSKKHSSLVFYIQLAFPSYVQWKNPRLDWWYYLCFETKFQCAFSTWKFPQRPHYIKTQKSTVSNLLPPAIMLSWEFFFINIFSIRGTNYRFSFLLHFSGKENLRKFKRPKR